MSQNSKITQNDLRKFMSQHKKKLSDTVKKVESPLAKYLEDGKLKCIVCNTVVGVWSTHIAAKEHRENIARRKTTLLNVQNTSSDSFKSPLPPAPGPKRPALLPIPQPPPKKLKSILKNAAPLPKDFFNKSNNSVVIVSEEDKEEEEDIEMTPIEPQRNGETVTKSNGIREPSVQEKVSVDDSDLPQGFFDDPILDAKARNVEYRDPKEEEWERFQREMKEETELSARILQDDSEESTVDRQIEEVDDQMNNWSRVLNLEKKKEHLESLLSVAQDIKQEDMSDENPDDDVDEYVSWRTKKSFK